MANEVLCPKCFKLVRPPSNATAESELAYHLKEVCTEGYVPTPILPPAKNQVRPDGYENLGCLVCGKTVKHPHWNSSMYGGGGRKELDLLAGNPPHVSEFWTKRQVRLEISTWMGTGAIGAKHWYGVLKEENDDALVLDSFAGETKVVRYNLYRDDQGRRVDVEALTREEAIRMAIEKYREMFGCDTHYLVHERAFLDTDTQRAAANLIRQMREGD